MSRHKSVETAVDKPDQVTHRTGTDRAILPAFVRTAFGLAGAALVLVAAWLPIWRAQFSAPQYPSGLNIAAYGSKVVGDLSEIKELSHYIGMPPLNFVGLREMRLWPLVILLGVLAAGLAVVTRRSWLRRLACATLWLMPVGALADVQFRLWQTGHSLDPTSAIRVPPFTPRVVGPTSLMNFTLWASPGWALVLIAVAAMLVTSAPYVARLLARSGRKATGAVPTDVERTDAETTDTELKVP
jgi:copper chaperone NosL